MASNPAKIEPDLSATVRKVPEIDPNNVTLEVAKAVTREFLIRLPEGTIGDDLKEPALWRKVQANPRKALQKFDRVLLVAFDESWLAEAIVSFASNSTVELAKPRLATLESRYPKLLETDEYRIKWFGTGFAVERKRDAHRMTSMVASAALAERDLVALYPKSAA